MSVFFCLSIILLQGSLSICSFFISDSNRYLSILSKTPQEWTQMGTNAPEYIDKGPLVKTNCTDDDCSYMELFIKRSIKESVRPCDDFYTHACGEWIVRHPSTGRSIIDQCTEAQQHFYADLKGYLTDPGMKYQSYLTNEKAKQFYKSCMNQGGRVTTGLKELRNMVSANGGWPLFSNNRAKTYTQKWQDVHKGYSENYSLPALFHLQVLPDRKDSTKHIIVLGSTFIDMRELSAPKIPFKTPHSPDEPRVAYRNLLKQVGQVLYDIHDAALKDNRVLKRKIDSMIGFQRRSNKLSNSGGNFHHDNSYKKMSIKDLQHDWDTILGEATSANASHYRMDWLETIRGIFAKSGVSVAIDENETIATEPSDYIKSLARLLINTNPETIVNYIHWNAIKNMLKYSGNKCEAIIHEYNRVVYGAESEEPRWLECIKTFPMEHALTERMGHSDELTNQLNIIKHMFYRVEGGFMTDIIAGNSQIKNTLLHKFSPDMSCFIGYPDWSRAVFNVSAYYKSLKVEDYNYFANMLRFNDFSRTKELQTLREPVNLQTVEWPISPTDFVAYYDDRTNSVLLPAGLLTHPYMGFYKVPVIQYGALGSVIGHEMAHEHLSDGLSQTRKGWTGNVSLLYENLERCYRTEHMNSTIELSTGDTFSLNLDLAMREIIADNMGFRMAFRAFKKFQELSRREVHLPNLETKFTQDQLFFYSLAQSFCENPTDEYLKNVYMTDEHPPSKIRINGVLSRMKEFHEVFQCQDGDRMKMPESKCSLWR